jgi:hypothetical protein
MIFFWNNCAFSTEFQTFLLCNEKRVSIRLSWNSTILIGSQRGQPGLKQCESGRNGLGRKGGWKSASPMSIRSSYALSPLRLLQQFFVPLRHDGWRKTCEIVRSRELDSAFNNLDFSRLGIRPQLINVLELFMCVRSHYLAIFYLWAILIHRKIVSTLDRPRLLCKLMGWGLNKSSFGSPVTCPTCEKPIFRL